VDVFGIIFWSVCPAILQFYSTSVLEQISPTFFLFLASFSSFLYHLLLAKRKETLRSEITENFGRPSFVALPVFASGVAFTAIPNFFVLPLFLTNSLSKVQHLLMFTISMSYIRELVYLVPMASEAVMEAVYHLLALVLSFFPGWIRSALHGQSVLILIATFATALAG
jgi:hypothetical protein